MDERISMYVLLVWVWCSLDAGGPPLMVVTAQPTVSAIILTPEADRKEGGQVDMRCTATNLVSDHIVEWRTVDTILRWGTNTLSTNERFTFTTYTNSLITIQNFAISNLNKIDIREYICNINDPISTGESNIVATSKVALSAGIIESNPSDLTSDPPSPSSPWIITFSVFIVLLAAFVSVTTIVIFFKVIKEERLEINVDQEPQDDLYMDLRLPGDSNSVYTRPVLSDTIRQPDKIENTRTECDYARSESSSNTSYEVVGVPTDGNNIIYRQSPARDTNFQPVEVENESPESDYARSDHDDSTNTSYEAARMPVSVPASVFTEMSSIV